MNPKIFVDLYDDGLQAEEIENEKNKNIRSTEGKHYQTGGTQQENTIELCKYRLSNNREDSQVLTSPYQKS